MKPLDVEIGLMQARHLKYLLTLLAVVYMIMAVDQPETLTEHTAAVASVGIGVLMCAGMWLRVLPVWAVWLGFVAVNACIAVASAQSGHWGATVFSAVVSVAALVWAWQSRGTLSERDLLRRQRATEGADAEGW